jgi:hypothetical protein
VTACDETYEEALAALRRQWYRHPHRRADISRRGHILQREREMAPPVAVHEVGHALAAHALGYRVACVSRAPRGSATCGHVRLLDWQHHDVAVLTAAGGCALSVIAGVAEPERGCASDRWVVERVALLDWDEQVESAEILLRGWEPQAKRLVVALKTRPWLTADEFVAVVTS